MSDGALGAVAAALAQDGIRVDSRTARPIGGGCIHAAWRLDGPDGPIFLKTNRAASHWLLEAEADGLAALRDAACLRVPDLYGAGIAGEVAWLALEWLDLHAPTPESERVLGEALARQHLVGHRQFGWRMDNAIGSTPQPNDPDDDWSRFFAHHRLGFQLEYGARRGLPTRLVERGEMLRSLVPALLADRSVVPALLHGDLWGGNRAAGPLGDPVVFDPAVHYGDPECDLAMTRLFGSFAPGFYAAYEAIIPPAPGRALREQLYQLYHVLNHANLFGGGYVGQAQRMIERLIAEA